MKKITLLMVIIFMTIAVQAQNKLLSSISEYNNNNVWEKSSGYNYEYDINNNLIAETYLLWNSTTNAWESYDKTTYTYNGSNKVTQAVYQNWDIVTNTIANSFRDLYTYNNGSLTAIDQQKWTGLVWVNDYRSAVTYTNNLPDVLLEYKWNGTQWINEGRTTFTYNASNNVISYVFEAWVGAQWVNNYKSINTYDANNKLITRRGADWDDFNGLWAQNGDKTETEWDATGNQTQNIEFYTSQNNGPQRYKTENTYDTTKLINNFAHPFKDKSGFDYFGESFPYVNKLTANSTFFFNSNTNSYDISSRTTYNYDSAITLGTESLVIANENYIVYPNPARDFITIQNESNSEIDRVIVTDLAGKKVLEQNNAKQVDVRNLAKGMYFIQALSGKNKFDTKFIKE